MNHSITITRDGDGHWLRITDLRTNRCVRSTWGKGTAAAAMREAKQIVQSMEWVEQQAVAS